MNIRFRIIVSFMFFICFIFVSMIKHQFLSVAYMGQIKVSVPKLYVAKPAANLTKLQRDKALVEQLRKLYSTQKDTFNEEKTLIISNATKNSHGFVFLKKSSFTKCPELEPWMKCKYEPSQPGNISRIADAVLVRAFHIDRDYQVPKEQPPSKQKWIFFETESPFSTWTSYRTELGNFWSRFNLSITYDSSADIQYNVYGFVCEETSMHHVDSGINYASGKIGNVLWISSHCNGTMGRELYVDDLKRYIDVQVYGQCGEELPDCGSYVQDLSYQCVEKIINKFKFYLSLENSMCEEYYTEKIGKTLQTNTIPIVMGINNYTDILKPGTFIDVRDFASPKELADYLHYLSNNDTAYNEYIIRKKQLTCYKRETRKLDCLLCEYLHRNSERTQMLPDLREHWGVERKCQAPEQFLSGIYKGQLRSSRPNLYGPIVQD